MINHSCESHEICQQCKHDPTLIRTLYFFGIIFWIALLVFIGWRWRHWNVIEWVILLIPIGLFIVAMYNVDQITPYVETWTMRYNAVSNIVVLIFPILVWATARVNSSPRFLLIVLLATGLSILSVIDVWTSDKYICLAKHSRSILQTISIALTLWALVQYYKDRSAFVDDGLPDEGEIIAISR